MSWRLYCDSTQEIVHFAWFDKICKKVKEGEIEVQGSQQAVGKILSQHWGIMTKNCQEEAENNKKINKICPTCLRMSPGIYTLTTGNVHPSFLQLGQTMGGGGLAGGLKCLDYKILCKICAKKLTWLYQGRLFFKKIWIIPQRKALSTKSFPTSELQVPPNQEPRSVFLTFFVMICWGGSIQCQMLASIHRGCLRRDVPPSEAGKFCIFETGIMPFGEYFWAQIWSR